MKNSDLEKLIDSHMKNFIWSEDHEKAIKETVKVFFEHLVGKSYGKIKYAIDDFSTVANRILESCEFTLEANE